MNTNTPSLLSDSDLVAAVNRLALSERRTTVGLISHLAELDSRRPYLSAGFSSLFTYCTGVLRLSEHEAYNRIEAARATRRFPILLGLLEQGRLNLSTVRLLAPHLTAENHQELLAATADKSKREAEELLAQGFPRPVVPSSIRRLPAVPCPPSAHAVPVEVAAAPVAPPSVPSPQPAPAVQPSLPPPARRPSVNPLAPDRYVIRFTASAGTCEKLRLAQDLLRHVVPDGDPAEIFDRALTVLLEDLARKKLAAAKRPAPDRAHSTSSRRVPARVKRSVWLRDGGRCAFEARSGRRCSERGFLEFHHVKPYAAGGQATVENMQLRCRAHNTYEAELYYGNGRLLGAEGLVREGAAARSGTSCAGTVEHIWPGQQAPEKGPIWPVMIVSSVDQHGGMNAR